MAVASPIKPSDLGAITTGVLACDHLVELKNTRTKMQTFLAWLLANDETGLLGADFKSAIIQQLLFDATKKGWIVRANPSSGHLELASNSDTVSELFPPQSIRLLTLAIDGAVDGDVLGFDGTSWVPFTPIYLAPTTGGTTIPDPSTGGILSVAHGFGAVPRVRECNLVCNATDAGYASGDTVDAKNLIQRGAGGETRPGVTVGADASVVFAVFVKEGSAARKYFLPNKASFEITDGSDSGEVDPSKWDVKFYASP